MSHSRALCRSTGAGLIFLMLTAALVGCATGDKAVKAVPDPGSYTLVGIGPGEADLLTTRALNAIRRADVVFCRAATRERLADLVDFSGKTVIDGYNVLFRYYGRSCTAIPASQRSWNDMSCEEFQNKQAEFVDLVRQAVSTGKHVVMLSGGDPTIYGPDLWTIKALADLKPVVVPGLSSLNAANAALKAGLGEIIITAPFQAEGRSDTVERLAGHSDATMVIFMPRDVPGLLERLNAAFAADTPVAVVADAGDIQNQKVVLGTVGDIGDRLDTLDIQRSLIYVGKPLAESRYQPTASSAAAGQGKFYLIGMGPGDADLATLRAIRAIHDSTLIFASGKIQERFAALLAGKQVLDGYGRLFPFYGKDCAAVTPDEQAREGMSCEEYHRKQAEFEKLVRQAIAAGQNVAMLDSGDPLIYGPCAWSLTALADLNTEVVPGLSSFNAANAALQAGVTEGKNSHSVLLASGWSVDRMAAHKATMVLFTMRTEFRKFIDALAQHYPPETPLGIVTNAGYSAREKVMQATLGTVVEQLGPEKLPFEYLLYVGDFLADGGQVAR